MNTNNPIVKDAVFDLLSNISTSYRQQPTKTSTINYAFLLSAK